MRTRKFLMIGQGTVSTITFSNTQPVSFHNRFLVLNTITLLSAKMGKKILPHKARVSLQDNRINNGS